MEISEYKELLLKYYTENHSFIEKAVFTVTAGAITFLLGYSENITEKYFVGYAISIFLFVSTLIIQLISAYTSKEGCDKGLENTPNNDAETLFTISRFLNNTFMILFVVAIIITSIVIMSNSKFINDRTVNNNYYNETYTETDDYIYQERQAFMKKMTASNGLNPPKAIKIIAQEGAVPPKSVKPAEPVQQPKEKK